MTPFLTRCDMPFSAWEKERRVDKYTPKYLYTFTIFNGVSPYFHFSHKAIRPPFLNTMRFDLSKLTTRPRWFAVLQSTVNWFYRPQTVSETKITSSANKRMKLYTKSGISCMPYLPRCIISLRYFIYKKGKHDWATYSPCLRPLGPMNDSVKSFPARTLLFTTLYILAMAWYIFLSDLSFLKVPNILNG